VAGRHKCGASVNVSAPALSAAMPDPNPLRGARHEHAARSPRPRQMFPHEFTDSLVMSERDTTPHPLGERGQP